MKQLTEDEHKAIKRIKRAFKDFPDTLLVYAGGTGLEIRKPNEDGSYFADTVVEDIPNVRNDGGDGGDFH